MSTRLTEHPNHWVVSTEVALGKRRKLPRGAVRVGKGDKAKLKAEMVRQAKQARLDFGIEQPTEEKIV